MSFTVIKHIICELTGYRPGTVDVSQGDRGSRAVSCRLMESGAPWMIPEGATARVAYTLPDGTEGLYDRRPDGTPMWEIAKNIVTVELADQLMAQAGMVQMSILIIGPEGGQLATWPIRVMVSANKAARLTVPEEMPPYGAGFAGKIFFGGADGTVTPLGIGAGVEIVRQEDGTFTLVAYGGSGGGGGIIEEKDPTVPAWAKQPQKPTYTAQEVGAMPAGTKIPGKTSELTNDAGFVTKAVSDLENYLTRAQTQELIAAIPRFRVTVVQQLPAAGEELVLYLVPFATAEGQYLEYIWVDGRWEIIGSQRVDLTGYATEEWVQEYVEEHSGQNVNVTIPDGKVIDLAKYGITAVDYEPPFTEEMYHVAYANGTGIQQAIDDAKAAGMTDVVLPAGRYPVCYNGKDNESNRIINIQGINLHAYDVTLYVIYDEDGTNPYFSGETPRLLQGSVIETDSDLYGIHLIGERKYRTSAEAKYREGSGGIRFGTYSNGNHIADCICEYFSGDGFRAGNHFISQGQWEGAEADFTAVAWNGSEFVYHEKKYTSKRHGASWLDHTQPIWLNPAGYNYNFWTHSPIKILCFDEAERYIGAVSMWQGEYFYFLPGTYYWYMELTFGQPHAEDSTVNYTVRIGYGSYSGTVLKNCISRYNQRGGFSNLPNNARMIECVGHHNGCAFAGMPAFYDSTQFGLDIEDIYINSLELERCRFYGSLQGVLWRSRNIRLIDCTIEGYTKSLNYCGGFHAEHTKFLGGLTLQSPAEYGRKIAIGCEVAGEMPQEITVLDDASKIPARAVLTGKRQTNLQLLNKRGDIVLEVDLSYLGKEIGEEPATNDLLFDMDFTKFSAGNLTLDDATGNATVEVNKSAEFTEWGIGKSEYSTATWDIPAEWGDEFSVEYCGLGNPQNIVVGEKSAILLSAHNLGGGTLPAALGSRCPIGTPSVTPSYINVNGESSSVTLSTVLKDAEDGIMISAENYPDSHLMTIAHLVLNYRRDGMIEIYVNGHRCVNGNTLEENFVADDFAAWDMSEFVNSWRIWRSTYNGRVLRAIRLYNGRCLSSSEVANNFKYEVDRLGTVHRVLKSVSNATLDNEPMLVRNGEPYTSSITAKDGYTLDGATVSVVMGDEDITATAYADGVVTVAAVTDHVTVTVKAVAAG